jgi:hypothetical protein
VQYTEKRALFLLVLALVPEVGVTGTGSGKVVGEQESARSGGVVETLDISDGCIRTVGERLRQTEDVDGSFAVGTAIAAAVLEGGEEDEQERLAGAGAVVVVVVVVVVGVSVDAVAFGTSGLLGEPAGGNASDAMRLDSGERRVITGVRSDTVRVGSEPTLLTVPERVGLSIVAAPRSRSWLEERMRDLGAIYESQLLRNGTSSSSELAAAGVDGDERVMCVLLRSCLLRLLVLLLLARFLDFFDDDDDDDDATVAREGDGGEPSSNRVMLLLLGDPASASAAGLRFFFLRRFLRSPAAASLSPFRVTTNDLTPRRPSVRKLTSIEHSSVGGLSSSLH